MSPDVLLRLLRRLLRPLVRMLIQAGVTFPAMADVMRQLYVDVAARDLLTDDRSRTDSRISILTGVHRKELRRLRGIPPDRTEAPPAVTIGAAVVARWLGVAPWIDDAGRPRKLPRIAPAGTPSFEALVETATKDVRARTVFEELLSQGLIDVEDDGGVVLNQAAFLPRPGREEQLFYFARNLHDHIAAAVANVSATGTAPFLDRSVHYDGLSLEAAARLETLARAAALEILVRINQEALRLSAAETPASGPTRRVNLGVYLFAEDEPPGDSR